MIHCLGTRTQQNKMKTMILLSTLVVALLPSCLTVSTGGCGGGGGYYPPRAAYRPRSSCGPAAVRYYGQQITRQGYRQYPCGHPSCVQSRTSGRRVVYNRPPRSYPSPQRVSAPRYYGGGGGLLHPLVDTMSGGGRGLLPGIADTINRPSGRGGYYYHQPGGGPPARW